MTEQQLQAIRAPIQINVFRPTYRHAGQGVISRTPSGFIQRSYSNRWGMEMAVRAAAAYPAVVEWKGEYDK